MSHHGRQPHGRNPVHVLFIGATGRSGSTLLDRMLGEVPGIFSAGELTHIWSSGFVANHLCACGAPFNSCPLWSAVGTMAFPENAGVDPSTVACLHNSVERHRHLAKLVSPRLLHRNPSYMELLREYRTVLGRLYDAIRHVSGDEVIIDSSKDPLHAFVLRNMAGVKLSVIHLVRDSRGVAHSWQRKRVRPEVQSEVRLMPTYSPWHSAFEWNRTNLLLKPFGRSGAGYARVRYEDLVAQPNDVLAGLLRQLLGRQGPLDFVADRVLSLSTTHAVAGNPMRFATGDLKLVQDDAWQREMPTSHLVTVSALTAPGLWRYGYRPRRGFFQNF